MSAVFQIYKRGKIAFFFSRLRHKIQMSAKKAETKIFPLIYFAKLISI